jgi:hypothetical protein
MLKHEIDAITAGRMEIARRNPGFFWDDEDGGRKLTREEARVFGIKYEEFPRMMTVWEAWFAFLGYVEASVFGHSDEAIEVARRQYPEAMKRLRDVSLLVVLWNSGYQGAPAQSARGALLGQFLKDTISDPKPRVSRREFPNGR